MYLGAARLQMVIRTSPPFFDNSKTTRVRSADSLGVFFIFS